MEFRTYLRKDMSTFHIWTYSVLLHCKKRLAIFPSTAGDVTNQKIPARESLVSEIPAGDGEIANHFYSVPAQSLGSSKT